MLHGSLPTDKKDTLDLVGAHQRDDFSDNNQEVFFMYTWMSKRTRF